MGKISSVNFHDYYMDDENVSPAQRAKIEADVQSVVFWMGNDVY
jgi:hypothetical protein